MTVEKKPSNGAALVALLEGVRAQIEALDARVAQLGSAIVGDAHDSGILEKLRALDLKVLGIENERKVEALKTLNDVMVKKEEARYAEAKEFRERIFRWLTAVGALIGAGSGVTGLLTR